MPSKDWSPRTIAMDKLQDAVEDGLAAFWAKIHKVFPVPSGDLDPLTVVLFQEHAFDVVLQWLANNHASEQVRQSMLAMLEKRKAQP